jgi:hypothetical protein
MDTGLKSPNPCIAALMSQSVACGSSSCCGCSIASDSKRQSRCRECGDRTCDKRVARKRR